MREKGGDDRIPAPMPLTPRPYETRDEGKGAARRGE